MLAEPATRETVDQLTWALSLSPMKLIQVSNQTPQKFARKVQKALHLGPLGKITEFKLDREHFVVSFSQLTTSQIFYQIKNHGTGFTASLIKENVSLAHSLFRQEVEKELKRIMQRFGAEIH